MAKGTLTIEFDSTSDLMSQLRFMLMGVGAMQTPDQLLPAPVPPKSPAEACVKIGESGSVFTVVPETPQPRPVAKEETDTVKPAQPDPLPAPAPEPTPEKAAQPAPEQTAPAVDGPVLTLETLKDQPYDVLLAFCAAHPEVGIEVEKCKPTFFRKLVENHITTYLNTVG